MGQGSGRMLFWGILLSFVLPFQIKLKCSRKSGENAMNREDFKNRKQRLSKTPVCMFFRNVTPSPSFEARAQIQGGWDLFPHIFTFPKSEPIGFF